MEILPSSVCVCVCLSMPRRTQFLGNRIGREWSKKIEIFCRLYGVQLDELKLTGNNFKNCKTGEKKYLVTDQGGNGLKKRKIIRLV